MKTEYSEYSDETEAWNKFSVTIDDGVDSVSYRYDFFLPGYASIHDLAKTIANKFDVMVPKPTYIQKSDV